jgi:hypothetical protein
VCSASRWSLASLLSVLGWLPTGIGDSSSDAPGSCVCLSVVLVWLVLLVVVVSISVAGC